MPNWKRIDEGRLGCDVVSELETAELGHQLGRCLAAGDVVALIGDLGAGKTRFVKAVAEAWDVPRDEVNSPTFTLIQEYAGRIPLRHCDAYRLRDAEEFADLGLDELFATDGIALVEWADRVENYLPRDRLVIRIAINSPTSRAYEVSATGARSRQVLTRLSGIHH
jgi:tRNA threonylcarbamoyladenosine biosynthesis protein TsaE